MVKHDDHAMTWYHLGNSYSPWWDHGKIMACHHEIKRDHGMAVMKNSMIMS